MVSPAAPSDILVAEVKDVRAFARLLKGIGLKHQAVMTISKAGFEITVEEVRTLCATAWVPSSLFDIYTYTGPPPSASSEEGDTGNPEPSCFEISLDALLLCLNIFGNAGPSSSAPNLGGRSKRRWAGEGEPGTNGNDAEGEGEGDWRVGRKGAGGRTGMRMSWKGMGYDLEVLLHDDGQGTPVTTCALRTMEPEELMNQELNDKDLALYLIMKSDSFRDALLDLPPSCNKITLTATPRHSDEPPPVPEATGSSNMRRTQRADVGNFSIAARGDFGMAELDYPADKEVMDKFDCEDVVRFSYHASHFNLLARALHQAVKICLQVENSGFLVVQIMMPVSESVALGEHSGILEFKMHALEEDEDE